MSRDEFKRRCQDEYCRLGFDEEFAAWCAEATTAAAYEDGSAHERSPEEAARDDSECWGND